MDAKDLMKQGFEAFFKARECFEKAIVAYGPDDVNSTNVAKAVDHLARAYDEVGEIWENDVQGK